MFNTNRRESTADSDLTFDIQQRIQIIEQKLAQLAKAERWHRELIQRYQLRQRASENANSILKQELITSKNFFCKLINFKNKNLKFSKQLLILC